MVGEAAPFLRAATLERRGPAALARRGWRAAGARSTSLADLPRDLRAAAARGAQRPACRCTST